MQQFYIYVYNNHNWGSDLETKIYNMKGWTWTRDKLTDWRYQTYQMYFRTALHTNDAFVIGQLI